MFLSLKGYCLKSFFPIFGLYQLSVKNFHVTFLCNSFSSIQFETKDASEACLFNYTYCWFSHDVTKIQSSEVMVLLRFYFHEV